MGLRGSIFIKVYLELCDVIVMLLVIQKYSVECSFYYDEDYYYYSFYYYNWVFFENVSIGANWEGSFMKGCKSKYFI